MTGSRVERLSTDRGLRVWRGVRAVGPAGGRRRGSRPLGLAELSVLDSQSRISVRAVRIHADGPDAGAQALPPRRLDLRGEGRRLEDAGLQGRRTRQPSEP